MSKRDDEPTAQQLEDAGWIATRMGYRQHVYAVLDQGVVLLEQAPRHVPVLAQDLAHMLDELLELDMLRNLERIRAFEKGR